METISTNQIEEQETPVTVVIPRQEKYSRGLALATLLFGIIKMFILIPHFIVLYFLLIAAFIGGIIAQIAVLFTARYPRSLFNLVAGTLRWRTRVNAYLWGLSDSYPPFSLSK